MMHRRYSDGSADALDWVVLISAAVIVLGIVAYSAWSVTQ